MSRIKCRKSEPGSKIRHHRASQCMASEPGRGWWTLRFDGGCQGNGRWDATGVWAYHLIGPAGKTEAEEAGPVGGFEDAGPVTVNVAEWTALAAGLETCVKLPTGTMGGLLIEGDSDLVVSQLTGVWDARGELREWRDECLNLLAGLYIAWHARWIPREQNAHCDALGRTVR